MWIGRADVERGRSCALPASLAALFSLPPDGKDQPLRVSFVPGNGQEAWTREFGAREFRSIQFESDGLLVERIGVELPGVRAGSVSPKGWRCGCTDVRVLGIPLPRMLHPRVRTFESEQDGRYRFEAEAHLPLVGLLVRYAGWLERAEVAERVVRVPLAGIEMGEEAGLHAAQRAHHLAPHVREPCRRSGT